jgi:tRNA (cmo5U34)-methyltransferase
MNENKPERMSDFFTARLDGYEEHMLHAIGTAMYEKIAELIPLETKDLLDLGCGTGLELEFIFKRLPDISVTGIDMTQSMLDNLLKRFPDRSIRLICGNYFDVPFGDHQHDCIVSVQTMHHFLWSDKVKLYRKIHSALKAEGVYIEADFIVMDQSAEDEYHAGYEAIRNGNNIRCGELYHIDIPYTAGHQIEMMKEAGFIKPEQIFRDGNAAIIIAAT